MVEALVENAIEAWDRSGAEGARGVILGLPPQEQIRVCIELYNRRELEPLLASIDESFVHDMRPTGIPGMEIYKGPDGYRRFIREWLDAFPDSSLEVEVMEMEGDVLFTAVRQDVHGGGSGVPVSFTYAAIITFREGRADTSEFHMDLDAARDRLGEVAAGTPRTA